MKRRIESGKIRALQKFSERKNIEKLEENRQKKENDHEPTIYLHTMKRTKNELIKNTGFLGDFFAKRVLFGRENIFQDIQKENRKIKKPFFRIENNT